MGVAILRLRFRHWSCDSLVLGMMPKLLLQAAAAVADRRWYGSGGRRGYLPLRHPPHVAPGRFTACLLAVAAVTTTFALALTLHRPDLSSAAAYAASPR